MSDESEKPVFKLFTPEQLKLQLKKLKEPLTPDEIEWRIGNKVSGGVSLLAYIDGRTVYNRFDRLFSCFWNSEIVNCPGTWFEVEKTKRGYQGKPDTKFIGHDNFGGGFLAKISIKYEIMPGVVGEVFRTDGADFSDVEAFKGGNSDAIKRCAHAFGLGRELYSYPKVTLSGDQKYIPYQVKDQLRQLTLDIIAKKIDCSRTITLGGI